MYRIRCGHDYMNCFRVKPVEVEQLIVNLRKERTTPEFPFNCSGAYFCGPLFIKYKNQRKGVYNNLYVCIFCMHIHKSHSSRNSD